MNRYAPLLRAQDAFRGSTLVLAPHPDDEIIAVGGTLALLGGAGVAVRVVHLTDGSGGDPQARFGDIVSVRREEGRRALAILGQGPAIAFGFRDGVLSAVLEEVVPRLTEEIHRYGADHVVAPSPFEAHPDHRAAAAAVCEVIARKPWAGVTQVSFYGVNVPVIANVLIDITSVQEAKQRALEEHASQIAYNDTRSAMRGIAAARTMDIPDKGVSACEALMRIPAHRLVEFFATAQQLERLLFPEVGSESAE